MERSADGPKDHRAPLPNDHAALLLEPYSPYGGCYGCGLEPEIMKPFEWVLCFWCNELRITMQRRTRVSLLGV